ncbi:MAG: hypothetical protein BJ554DRAFT_7991 [Olpidium bornovanus]|uniref:Uncharacterized protein n=1 Tax=Olpidium bornovanus TaxID=278681 RepID=A0A8H8DLX5_9FUNG|nr:MAG: hypothetical protein BJ554DRAFT_7991 [Olpidium bornovanus]
MDGGAPDGGPRVDAIFRLLPSPASKSGARGEEGKTASTLFRAPTRSTAVGSCLFRSQ